MRPPPSSTSPGSGQTAAPEGQKAGEKAEKGGSTEDHARYETHDRCWSGRYSSVHDRFPHLKGMFLWAFILKVYILTLNGSVDLFDPDGNPTAPTRHPANMRAQPGVMIQYVDRLTKKGLMIHMRGLMIATMEGGRDVITGQDSGRPPRYYFLAGGTLMEAVYDACKRFRENPYVQNLIEFGIPSNVCIIHSNTPHDVALWIKRECNTHHQGSSFTFWQSIEESADVTDAWSAHCKLHDISKDNCPVGKDAGDKTYYKQYSRFVEDNGWDRENFWRSHNHFVICTQILSLLLTVGIFEGTKSLVENNCNFLDKKLNLVSAALNLKGILDIVFHEDTTSVWEMPVLRMAWYEMVVLFLPMMGNIVWNDLKGRVIGFLGQKHDAKKIELLNFPVGTYIHMKEDEKANEEEKQKPKRAGRKSAGGEEDRPRRRTKAQKLEEEKAEAEAARKRQETPLISADVVMLVLDKDGNLIERKKRIRRWFDDSLAAVFGKTRGLKGNELNIEILRLALRLVYAFWLRPGMIALSYTENDPTEWDEARPMIEDFVKTNHAGPLAALAARNKETPEELELRMNREDEDALDALALQIEEPAQLKNLGFDQDSELVVERADMNVDGVGISLSKEVEALQNFTAEHMSDASLANNVTKFMKENFGEEVAVQFMPAYMDVEREIKQGVREIPHLVKEDQHKYLMSFFSFLWMILAGTCPVMYIRFAYLVYAAVKAEIKAQNEKKEVQVAEEAATGSSSSSSSSSSSPQSSPTSEPADRDQLVSKISGGIFVTWLELWNILTVRTLLVTLIMKVVGTTDHITQFDMTDVVGAIEADVFSVDTEGVDPDFYEMLKENHGVANVIANLDFRAGSTEKGFVDLWIDLVKNLPGRQLKEVVDTLADIHIKGHKDKDNKEEDKDTTAEGEKMEGEKKEGEDEKKDENKDEEDKAEEKTQQPDKTDESESESYKAYGICVSTLTLHST